MAGRKSGLGRGLDSLIPVDRPPTGFAEIPVDQVSPNPQQPRRSFDADSLAELAASMAEVGVLQPIVVRSGAAEGTYVLIAGERRLRAAAMAGFDEIPAVIRGEEGEEFDLTEALIENVQRKDLSPLEEAAAYRNLLEDFGMTHEDVAGRVGKSRSAVTNTLRLLQLPPPIQGLLDRGDLSAGHARALLALDDDVYATYIAERAVVEGWPVRRVEEAVRQRREAPEKESGPKVVAPRPAAIIELEERLSERL
ncbi:MAG: ParB/RepB/Spo0J family partition protein, partial [Actinomycetota bacterium]|nr:ParB/RepB/Spo0J family partition protein [Actinomycetota bacterium]